MNKVINNEALFKNTNEITSYSLKALCEMYGIKSMIGIPIYNHSKLIGVFGIEWVLQESDSHLFLKDNKDYYNEFSNKIQEFNLYIS